MTRRVAVVTGARADFGLLEPVMRAIDAHDELTLLTIATGSHLLPRDDAPPTAEEVAARFPVHARIEMQRPGAVGRLADADALGRGMVGISESIGVLKPDVMLVLGDRIEAFAAAAAGSVAGVVVAHIHGGDRAEGVADEAMRHAITKLAHLHFPATPTSRERILRMGEDPEFVTCAGSPAIDALRDYPPLDARHFEDLGAPRTIILLHPTGAPDGEERERALRLRDAVEAPAVWLHPNHDPGRDGIIGAMRMVPDGVRVVDHLERSVFVGLLKSVRDAGGALVGNSSAGLIEAAAIGLPVVDVGARQAGRERPNHVVHTPGDDAAEVRRAIDVARALDRTTFEHPYGDGRAGERIAERLAAAAPTIRKRNAY